jgi:hypothetical protein
MKNLVRFGGVGVLMQALIFAELTLFFAALLPALGYGESVLTDPALALPFVAAHPWLWHLSGPDVVYALALLLGALGVHEHLRASQLPLLKIATAWAMVGVPLFLGLGLIELVAVPQLAQRYTQNPAEASTAFVATNAVMIGLETAGIFSAGGWTLLVSLVALQAGTFNKVLNWVGALTGLMTMVSVFVPALALIAVLPNLIWTIGLGSTLLRGKSAPQPAQVLARA